MSESKSFKEMEEIILLLETRIKHLTNDLRLTSEENEVSTIKYFDIYSNMEKKVEERTRELSELKNILEQKNKELIESEERYRSVFEHTGTATIIFGEDQVITMSNTEFEELCGYKRVELEKTKKYTDFFSENEIGRISTLLAEKSNPNNGLYLEEDFEFFAKDGTKKYIDIQMGLVPGTNERIASLRDITQRKKMEQSLISSIKEKKVLLKEVHHRVKNNMQVISSLLNLQSGFIKDNESLRVFKESQSRIRSMALIHETLYKSDDLAKVDFSEYTGKLSQQLFQTYQVDPEAVELKCQIENVFLGIDIAIPCGLIINELVANALKHAFPNGNKGKISIYFQQKNSKYILTVSDDGIGFPDNLNYEESDTLGLQLVTSLTDQIDGTITLDKSSGTVFEIIF